MPVAEADSAEQCGEDHKATQLDWATPDVINQHNRYPVPGNVPCARKDQISHRSVVQDCVHVAARRVSNSIKNGRIIQTEPPECDIDEKPITYSPEQYLAVLQLRKVLPKIAGSCFCPGAPTACFSLDRVGR